MRPDGPDHLGAVASHPRSCGPDHRDGPDVEASGLVRHRADRPRRALERFWSDLAGLLETLTQPRHDSTVGHRPPRTVSVGVQLGDVELDRVGADVDDGVPLRHPIDQQAQAGRDVEVAVVAHAQPLDRRHDRCSVRRLDRDRRRSMPFRLEDRPLGLAAPKEVSGAFLVDLDDPRAAVRCRGRRRDQGVEGQPFRRDGRELLTETLKHHLRGRGIERERGLEDRLETLETRLVGLAVDLDVHQTVPDLEVVPSGGEQVDLVGLLDAGRHQRVERRTCTRGSAAETAPLPPRDDLGHAPALLTRPVENTPSRGR